MHSTLSIPTKQPAEYWRGLCAFGGYAFVAAVLLLVAYLHHETVRMAALPLNPACTRWDTMAADTVARLVHEPADASLRQAGDALFRLRRARSNCRTGWLALSCRDYRAIARLRPDPNQRVSQAEPLCSQTNIE
jgi:hypothetical protein